MKNAGGAQETFALGWREAPGRSRVVIGSVTLPDRPTTLGEARSGLRMVGCDEQTAGWLRAWAESGGEERSLFLCLPGGWFELCAATIAPTPRAGEDYVIRFDRRLLGAGPDA